MAIPSIFDASCSCGVSHPVTCSRIPRRDNRSQWELVVMRVTVIRVQVTLLRGPGVQRQEPDDTERRALLDLLDALLVRFRPDVLIGHGTSSLVSEGLERGRKRGVTTALRVTDCSARGPSA